MQIQIFTNMNEKLKCGQKIALSIEYCKVYSVLNILYSFTYYFHSRLQIVLKWIKTCNDLIQIMSSYVFSIIFPLFVI